MENNFIKMAVSAGHAVAYTIDPIFKKGIWRTLHVYEKRNIKKKKIYIYIFLQRFPQ